MFNVKQYYIMFTFKKAGCKAGYFYGKCADDAITKAKEYWGISHYQAVIFQKQ